MMIVLDTNVLARATPGKAGPAAAVRRAIRPPHLLVVSPYLLTELARALRYERLREFHGMNEDEIDGFLAAIQASSLMVDTAPSGKTIVANDPTDDPIVMTAVMGRADVLCTLDRDLHEASVVRFCASHGIRVLRDTELLAELRTA